MNDEKLLEKNDIDTLVNHTDGEENDQSGKNNSEQIKTQLDPVPDLKRTEDPKMILAKLLGRAHVERDQAVQVIWNASGVFPLKIGTRMKIENKSYISLGAIDDTHLIVGAEG